MMDKVLLTLLALIWWVTPALLAYNYSLWFLLLYLAGVNTKTRE